MRALAACAFGIILLASGCVEREAANPFDPENPDTNGTPPLLEATADNGAVALTWDLGALDDAAAVRLVRTVPGELANVLFEDPGQGAGAYRDTAVENEVELAYRLEVRTPRGEWLATASELATPGSAEPWVGDASGGGLVRLSPDGRDRIAQVDGFRDLLDLQIDADTTLWAADFRNGEVIHYGKDADPISVWTYSGSNTLALDPLSGHIWIGSFTQQQVVRVDRFGGHQHTIEGAGLVEDVSPGVFPEGGIWVASRFSGVMRIVLDQVTTTWTEFEWPVALAHDPRGWVWVIDRGNNQVSQILVADGRVIPSTATFVDPRDGSLDGVGGFWVADPGRSGLVHVDGAGREQGFLAVGAFDAVTVDPFRQHLWAVDRQAGRIVVFDTAGLELARVSIGGSPVKVEGSWGS